MKNIQILPRIIASSLFITVLAGTWDVWWHGALGRESFWSPPHLLLYSSVIVAISSGAYGWYKTKEIIWKRLAIILLIIPITAPFDELWHRVYGVEPISSPLIIWSPPHLALIASLIASLVLLLSVLKPDEDVSAKRLFGSMVFASILSLLTFLTQPLHPVGAWALLGFWGAGIISFMFVLILMIAKSWIPGIGSATLFVVFLIILSSISFDEKISPDVDVHPHDHSPPWLTVFSFLIPGIFLDFNTNKSILFKAGLAGLLWSGILFSFSTIFFEPQFQYSIQMALVAIFSSLIGGILAGIVSKAIIMSKLMR